MGVRCYRAGQEPVVKSYWFRNKVTLIQLRRTEHVAARFFVFVPSPRVSRPCFESISKHPLRATYCVKILVTVTPLVLTSGIYHSRWYREIDNCQPASRFLPRFVISSKRKQLGEREIVREGKAPEILSDSKIFRKELFLNNYFCNDISVDFFRFNADYD